MFGRHSYQQGPFQAIRYVGASDSGFSTLETGAVILVIGVPDLLRPLLWLMPANPDFSLEIELRSKIRDVASSNDILCMLSVEGRRTERWACFHDLQCRFPSKVNLEILQQVQIASNLQVGGPS